MPNLPAIAIHPVLSGPLAIAVASIKTLDNTRLPPENKCLAGKAQLA
jgi:hypothetical protein